MGLWTLCLAASCLNGRFPALGILEIPSFYIAANRAPVQLAEQPRQMTSGYLIIAMLCHTPTNCTEGVRLGVVANASQCAMQGQIAIPELIVKGYIVATHGDTVKIKCQPTSLDTQSPPAGLVKSPIFVEPSF